MHTFLLHPYVDGHLKPGGRGNGPAAGLHERVYKSQPSLLTCSVDICIFDPLCTCPRVSVCTQVTPANTLEEVFVFFDEAVFELLLLPPAFTF